MKTAYSVIDTARGGKKLRMGMYWYAVSREVAQARCPTDANDPSRFRVQTEGVKDSTPVVRS